MLKEDSQYGLPSSGNGGGGGGGEKEKASKPGVAIIPVIKTLRKLRQTTENSYVVRSCLEQITKTNATAFE